VSNTINLNNYSAIPNSSSGSYSGDGFFAKGAFLVNSAENTGLCFGSFDKDFETFTSNMTILGVSAEINVDTPSSQMLASESAIVGYVSESNQAIKEYVSKEIQNLQSQIDQIDIKPETIKALKQSSAEYWVVSKIIAQNAPYIVTDLAFIPWIEKEINGTMYKIGTSGFYTYFESIAACLAYLEANNNDSLAQIYTIMTPSEENFELQNLVPYCENLTIDVPYELMITFEHISLEASDNTMPIVSVTNTANFTMSAPCVNGNNLAQGFYIDNSTVTLVVDKITDGHSKTYGGGLYGVNHSNINLTGTFNGCYAVQGGGGLCFNNGGTFNLTLTSEITGCYTDGDGGAIQLLGELTSFETVNSPVILDCRAANGGAIAISASQAVTFGGQIQGCQATQCGGGIFFNNMSTAFNHTIITSISDCKAQKGGGIAASSATMTLQSVISNCQASLGGGVYVEGSDTNPASLEIIQGMLRITGCSVTGDDATALQPSSSGNGGGLYLSGNVNFSGEGSIENCEALWGGGIYLDEINAFTLGSITLKDNTAIFNGGAGVIVGTSATLNGTVEGCSISSNTESDTAVLAQGLMLTASKDSFPLRDFPTNTLLASAPLGVETNQITMDLKKLMFSGKSNFYFCAAATNSSTLKVSITASQLSPQSYLANQYASINKEVD